MSPENVHDPPMMLFLSPPLCTPWLPLKGVRGAQDTLPVQMLTLGKEKKAVLCEGSLRSFPNDWWLLSVCSQSQENLNLSLGWVEEAARDRGRSQWDPASPSGWARVTGHSHGCPAGTPVPPLPTCTLGDAHCCSLAGRVLRQSPYTLEKGATPFSSLPGAQRTECQKFNKRARGWEQIADSSMITAPAPPHFPNPTGTIP